MSFRSKTFARGAAAYGMTVPQLQAEAEELDTDATPVSVLSLTVTLTDAQIKALPTTAVEIIPAPGAGKVIFPVGCLATMNAVAAYTNINADSWIVIDTDATALMFLSVNEDGGAVGNSAFLNGTPCFAMCNAPVQMFLVGWGIVADAGIAQSLIVNKALRISSGNSGSGNYTGGNAANTLKVTVLYMVVDV